MSDEGKTKAVELRWNGSDWEPTGREVSLKIRPGGLPPGAEIQGVSVQPETPGCKWVVREDR